MNVTLLCLVLANAAPYFSLLAELEPEAIKLCELEDNQSEKEENQGEKDTDDKLKSEKDAPVNVGFEKIRKTQQATLRSATPHHPEIQTPPPKRSTSTLQP